MLKKIIPLVVVTLFCISGLFAQTPKAGIFYSVTGNGLKDTSYLFGTYHLVKQEFLNDKTAVQDAFKKAKGVVVELVLDSNSAGKVQTAGLLSDNTLSNLLDKPFLDSLDTELKNSIGVGVDKVNQLTPMNVTLTLSMVYTMINNKALFDQYKGEPLDGYIAKSGTDLGKTVTTLETIQQQMDLLFKSQSLDEQINGLKSFLRNKKAMVELGDELVKNWFANDMKKIVEVYDATLKLLGEEDRLVSERNQNWMKTLPSLINKQSQFIAVGALHLGGKMGLVHLLQQKGYTVTPLTL